MKVLLVIFVLAACVAGLTQGEKRIKYWQKWMKFFHLIVSATTINCDFGKLDPWIKEQLWCIFPFRKGYQQSCEKRNWWDF